MSKPLAADALVTRFKDRCALAISSNDTEAGMQLLRDFHAVASELYLTIIPPQIAASAIAAKSQVIAAKSAFTGRLLQAKFAGRCAVCSRGFEVGAPILYDQKRAAHKDCGDAE